ncbi:uncharacterized protein LOC134177170 [Corticium candelabrum]|uniref:uncharacterized protein LOC134177170 n=1 Tax=Corticium candelabrum TaxID=121492 RepID=UPI002E275858|nr:uncharacterized protein LOC134177170 [Corticium candelabrum]XP_062499906.1 uncharacterized protein LOC134177170 [Corticium candelabrum]
MNKITVVLSLALSLYNVTRFSSAKHPPVCLKESNETSQVPLMVGSENLVVYLLEGQAVVLQPNSNDNTRIMITMPNFPNATNTTNELKIEKLNASFHSLVVYYTVNNNENNVSKSENVTLYLGAEPSISSNLTKERKENSTVHICVDVMGIPKPDFEVFMNEQRLPKEDYETYNMEDTECLTFDERKRNDKGEIIICAHNCFGEKNITFSLADLENVDTKSSRMSASRVLPNTESPQGTKDDSVPGYLALLYALIAIFSVSVVVLLTIFLYRYLKHNRSSKDAIETAEELDLPPEPCYAQPIIPSSDATTNAGEEAESTFNSDDTPTPYSVKQTVHYAELDPDALQTSPEAQTHSSTVTYTTINKDQPRHRVYAN